MAAGTVEKEYYGNGTLKSVGRMVDGKRHGRWKFYHKDGKLWSIGTFVHGEGVGLFKWYAANGRLRQMGRFDEKGRQTGPWKRYYGGTTQLFDSGKWLAGKKVGVWKTFDKKGNVKRTQTYKTPAKPRR